MADVGFACSMKVVRKGNENKKRPGEGLFQ
jgi:hypothetical protein